MQIIKGFISQIEYKNNSGHEKKVVTLKGESNQRAFIEFRGQEMMKELKQFTEDDYIETAVFLEGKISRSTGIHFNNLVAKGIRKA